MMKREAIEEQIEDWVQRLGRLFAQLDEWHAAMPGAPEVIKGEVAQRMEAPLEHYGLTPRMLPSRTYIVGKRGADRVTFTPSSLWFMGSNGRVNVSTEDRLHLLLDMAGFAQRPSDWQFLTSTATLDYKSLDFDIFAGLLTRGRYVESQAA